MKSIRKIIYSCCMLAGLSLTITSCDMDQMPHNAIPTDKSWEQVSDAEKFRTGLYSYYQGANGGTYYYSPDLQSDLFNALKGFGNNGGQMHKWSFDASDGDTSSFWSVRYGCISAANNIINNIEKLEPANNLEEAYLEVTLGDAYLIRAICYHELALRFAKDYEPGTTEPGLPLVTAVDVNEKPSRSTLEETYEFILQDIDAALPLLDKGQQTLYALYTQLSSEGAAGKIKANIATYYLNDFYLSGDAAKVLKARVLLYMHKFDEAAQLAESLISAGDYPLSTSEDSYKAMWVNDEGSEIIFRTFSSVSERANPIPHYMMYSTASKKFSPYYIPNQATLDLYEEADLRSKVFFTSEEIKVETVDATVFLFTKFPGNPELKKADEDRYHMFKPFRIAEMYLIAAEANYQAGKVAAAQKALNDLRKGRGASAIESAGEALFTEIQNEWIREFIGEGRRLEDLKRWHQGLDRSNKPVQNEEAIVSGDTYEKLKIDANDMKFVWEVPMNDQRANPNLKPNWK